MNRLYMVKSKFKITHDKNDKKDKENEEYYKDFENQEIKIDFWTHMKLYYYKHSIFRRCCFCFKTGDRTKQLLKIYNKGFNKLQHEYDMKSIIEHMREYDH